MSTIVITFRQSGPAGKSMQICGFPLGIFGIEKTITLNGIGWVWTPLRLYTNMEIERSLANLPMIILYEIRVSWSFQWTFMQNQSSQQFNGCKATNSKHFILREKFVYGSIKKKDSSLMMVDQSQVFLLGKKDYIWTIWPIIKNQYLVCSKHVKTTFIFNTFFECPRLTKSCAIFASWSFLFLLTDGNSSMFVSVHPWYSSIRGFSRCAIFSKSKRKLDTSFDRSQVFFTWHM